MRPGTGEDTVPRRERLRTYASSPAVVLGVCDADPVAHRTAWEFALRHARRRGLPVRVVHGCGLASPLTPQARWVEEEQLHAGRRVVRQAAQQLRLMSRSATAVETVCSREAGAEALLTAAGPASLIVLQACAPHRTALAGAGSTVRAVAARAVCPVVVLHGEQPWHPDGPVVVGVEEHGRAQTAVRTAMEEADRAAATVLAVHAWEVPMNVRTTGYVPAGDDELDLAVDRAELILAEALAGVSEDFPTVGLRREAVRGPVVDVLRAVAQDAGLLVVARHASSRLAFHALGRTARALLHQAPCPLMLTPPGILRATCGDGDDLALGRVR